MKASKGSITVMLILVFCSVLMAVTLLVEVARIRIAEGQVKRAVDTAVFSALADYDQDTKDSYGLFYRYGTEGIEEEIRLAIDVERKNKVLMRKLKCLCEKESAYTKKKVLTRKRKCLGIG